MSQDTNFYIILFTCDDIIKNNTEIIFSTTVSQSPHVSLMHLYAGGPHGPI